MKRRGEEKRGVERNRETREGWWHDVERPMQEEAKEGQTKNNGTDGQ